MDRFYKLLVLDTIYHVLTLKERIQIHLIRLGKNHEMSFKSSEYLKLIVGWQEPELSYGTDREQYYINEKERRKHISEYPKENKELTAKVNELKNKYKK